MGLFTKIEKTVKNIAKNPLKARNYADFGLEMATAGQIDTHGINGIKDGNSFKDIMMGKKSKDIKPDKIADMIRASQMKGVTDINNTIDQNPADDIIRTNIEAQKKGLLTSAQDARRNAQQVMAKTGLKNSSLGLALNRGITQEMGEKVNELNASIPGAIRDQKLKDATTRINLGGLGTPNGINYNTIQGQRSGGVLGIASALAPLAGQAFGAYKDYQTGQLAARS